MGIKKKLLEDVFYQNKGVNSERKNMNDQDTV